MGEYKSLAYRVNLDGTVVKRILDFLTYSSVYLSIAGAVMAYMACQLQGLDLSWQTMAIMFFVTYSVYNIDRKADEDEDSINHSQRYSFTKKYEKFLFLSSILAYIFAFLLAYPYGLKALLVTAIPLVSGLLYSFAWLPSGFRYRRLKEIPSVKNLVIATAWASTPAFLPSLVYGQPMGDLVSVTFIYFFSLVFVNTVIFDMRDIEGDSISGVDTIPVLLGAEKTRILLICLTLLAGYFMINTGIQQLGIASLLVLAAGVIYALCYIIFFGRITGNNSLCDLMADGQFIILGGLLIVATGMGLAA